ncbi:DHA2 family efflux MFS transporter permease subunit [Neobacillus ginsengisoli]|uniref:EmrB/QacA subfamily drug resistance transporter n=1 Tax=Neobacillus ginsengisoli TaxID=904295 RepID=A0ABT9XWH4_9BACI|nr:DHA2 family efflux MFS transporter permease subunit [Neobacillus ginsengisoli]MDQ0199930.1 EmrB/QacA subfamily drug resistance transporter [Neobacillus ginsengisoli]
MSIYITGYIILSVLLLLFINFRMTKQKKPNINQTKIMNKEVRENIAQPDIKDEKPKQNITRIEMKDMKGQKNIHQDLSGQVEEMHEDSAIPEPVLKNVEAKVQPKESLNHRKKQSVTDAEKDSGTGKILVEQSAGSLYEIERIKSPALQMTIIILGVFMAILDTSVVNVAIPKMETALNASTDQIQWVVTGYMLVLGMLIPISGWLTDKFGAKKLFLFSLTTFTIGSALCGFAWNLESIIIFRIVQALGGALMQPVAMAMIFRIYPPERRGTVMGIFGIAMMAAPAFGPALSGYLVEYWSWRYIFYINVPIGIVAVILGVLMMHEFPHEAKGKFDILGFIFSIIGFGSLLYGFNELSAKGWGSTEVVSFLSVGVLCLIILVIVELKVKHPMIQLKVFKNYQFNMSLILSSLVSISMFVGVFFLPLYLQNIRGFSAVRTGLFMTPAALASAVIMPISGRLFDRIGARPLGIAGLVVVTLATLGFTNLGVDTSSNTIQWFYILRSAGVSMVMMPLMTAGMNSIPFELTSQGTAMNNTIRQVTSSLGTAILTTYMTTQSKIAATHMSWQVTPTSQSGQFLMKIQQLMQAHGMGVSGSKQAALTMMNGLIQQNAFVAGMNDAFMVATLLTAVGVILVFFYGRKKHSQEDTLKKSNKAVMD